MLPRRRLLQSALAGLALQRSGVAAAAQPSRTEVDRARVLALARVVLPEAIAAEGLERAVDAFLAWLRDYRAGAERDHGYGVTAVRVLPASPVAGYSAQLDDLDRRAGGRLDQLPTGEQRRVVTEAIEAARIRNLPGRPTGGHIATDLMAHYFRSSRANDLAYGRAIGREACRDLAGSASRPTALTGGPGR